MAGVRDKVLPHCFSIKIDIIWNIVRVELPQIVPKIAAILAAIEKG